MKTYKEMGRFGGAHAGSCLFAWSLSYLNKEWDSSKQFLKYGKKQLKQFPKCAHVLFTYSNFEY